MKRLSFLLLFVATSAFAAAPSTVNNDDSCDVTVSTAATLLLPYFEVDLANRTQDTLFTITNVTRHPQIAHVTIWTDWSFPVLSFNIYLTGYDVQGLSMQQVLGGVIAQTNGTGPTTAQSPVGPLSAGFTANPNFAGGGASINCSNQPGVLDPTLVAALKRVLTAGVYDPGGASACANPVGGVHTNAIGYVTIDVVSNCSQALPTDPLYYTNDLLFDNVFIGDYQQLGPGGLSYDAGVNSLVHIRAVPEGGGAGSRIASVLPYTFYDRFTPSSSRTIDRRQPLPSTFAARFVQGDPGVFRTHLHIWREGVGSGSCSDARSSAAMDVAEIVRFDEHENPFVLGSDSLLSRPRLPATSSTSSSNSLYPATTSSDFGGWFYLNLGNGGSTSYSATHDDFAPAGSTTRVGPRPSQNWVTVTMFSTLVRSTQAMAAEFDAASLGNGCSPAAFPTSATPIGPAGGVFVCPPGTTLTNGSVDQCTNTAGGGGAVASAARRRAVNGASPAPSIANDDSCDIKVGPAATLLLPYFEVDVSGTSGQTTLFTVTNVSRYPQIARVTLWTDYAYPVLTFNLFLGGYAVQPINLADVLIRNTIALPNSSISTAANPNLRASTDCSTILRSVPETVMAAVRTALTTGAGGSSCNRAVGSTHANAIGYATIDVVASCTTRSPADPLYYTEDLLFDNVLIGDYQQLAAHPSLPANFQTGYLFDAAGNPMVHIRAVPEGGGAGSNVATRLPFTFYDRYTPAGTRTIDRRQPLPSLFAARYVQGGPWAFETKLAIWREGFGTGRCADAFQSSNMVAVELVRFDEHENPNVTQPCSTLCLPPPPPPLNAASSNALSNSAIFPHVVSADTGGWIYLNLNNGGSTGYSVTREIGGERLPTNARTTLAPFRSGIAGPRPSQNWVTITMTGTLSGGNRLTGAFDAAPLGNGCSPAPLLGDFIGPAGLTFVCPPGTTLTNGSRQQCTGTNVNPQP